jgi:hypothetical protein
MAKESSLAAARKLVRFGTCLDAFYSSGLVAFFPGLWIRIQHFCSIRIQAKTELSKTISFSNFVEIKI